MALRYVTELKRYQITTVHQPMNLQGLLSATISQGVEDAYRILLTTVSVVKNP